MHGWHGRISFIGFIMGRLRKGRKAVRGKRGSPTQRSLTEPEPKMPEFLDRLARLGVSQTAALLRALLAL
jgi:hypothetical protein